MIELLCVPCSTREELGWLRSENDTLENKLLLKEDSLRVAEERLAEARQQLAEYESPIDADGSGAGAPVVGKRLSNPVMMMGGELSDRLMKQLKGEIHRLKQKEEIGALREKESHRTIQYLTEKLDKATIQLDTLQRKSVHQMSSSQGGRKAAVSLLASCLVGGLTVSSMSVACCYRWEQRCTTSSRGCTSSAAAPRSAAPAVGRGGRAVPWWSLGPSMTGRSPHS